jgi:hypothetical protein
MILLTGDDPSPQSPASYLPVGFVWYGATGPYSICKVRPRLLYVVELVDMTSNQNAPSTKTI